MILRAQDIRFGYAEEPILDQLDLTLVAGDHVALVGPNGCGKSTLIRMLTGSLEPDSGTVQIHSDARLLTLEQIAAPQGDESVRSYLERGLSDWQEIKSEYEAALQALEAAPEDALALERFGQAESRFGLLDGYAYPARIDAALSALGLMELAAACASQLSGGQQHRCRLARLLLTPADLWILDEPTNHLDDDGINWLVQLLSNCKHAWLVISHDRYLLEHSPTWIGELDHGRVERYPAPYSAYLAARARRREQLLKEWAAFDEEAARLRAFVAKYKAGQKSKQASARAKALERLVPPPKAPSARTGLPIAFEHVPRSADEVIKIHGLQAGYDDVLVSAPETLVRRGERIVLKGTNGCGKSTLLRTLMGDLTPLAGEVEFGVKVRPAILSQQIDQVLGRATAGEWLERQVPVERIQAARNLAGGLGLPRQALLRMCDRLSGGERMRLALTSLLLRDLNLIVLDEPTNHLDLRAREGLEGALCSYPGTLLVVSHDRAFCDRIATRWWSIHERRLHESAWKTSTPAAENASSSKPKGAQLKERQKQRRRLVAARDKLERLIDQLSEEAEAVGRELSSGEAQQDWEALQRLEDKRQAILERQTQAELDWLEASERVESFDQDLPRSST